jgi:enamine deaminase RidA (YjgF/YER057c/UK114 family)
MSATSHIQTLHPGGWKPARGYSNGMVAEGRTVWLGGQIGWNGDQVFETDDFVGQVRQALENIVAILAEAGGRPEHIVRMTWFVVDREEYLASLREIGAAWRELIGPHYPAMAVVEVKGLIEAEARLEIETTAVIG